MRLGFAWRPCFSTRILTSGGSSGIRERRTTMNLSVPEEFVQQLIRQTDGSALQREHVAAHVRNLVMAAPVPSGDQDPAVTVATVQPSGGPVPRIAAQLPKYAGFSDLQSPEEFLERLENFCLITGVAADKRLSQVVPAALEGSAKLWWRFVGDFPAWDDFTSAFRAEFASIDAKRRLKDELRQRTQHPEENLKEFIYTIAAYYERIGEEVPDSEKVDRVLRQMHPQLQDLAEGAQFASLAELAKAADGLMERAWRRLQYKPPPPQSNQVARDLAFRPAHGALGLPGPPAPVMTAAAVAPPPAVAPSAYRWPLHPAAIQPSYHRDLLCGPARSATPAAQIGFPTSQWQQQPNARHAQCQRCGGVGHAARNCATGRRFGPPLCFRCQQPGHFQAQCPGNGNW